eukprot:1161284-Pelagomonas_calceolata.AAC.2
MAALCQTSMMSKANWQLALYNAHTRTPSKKCHIFRAEASHSGSHLHVVPKHIVHQQHGLEVEVRLAHPLHHARAQCGLLRMAARSFGAADFQSISRGGTRHNPVGCGG